MNKHRWLNLLLIDNSKLPLFTKRFLCPLGHMDNKFKHMSISGDCSEIAPGEGYLFPSPCRRSNRHCCYRKIHNDTMTQRWPIRRDGCGRGVCTCWPTAGRHHTSGHKILLATFIGWKMYHTTPQFTSLAIELLDVDTVRAGLTAVSSKAIL